MRIACDIDGCINNLVDKTLEMYNDEANRHIQVSDIVSYNFYDCHFGFNLNLFYNFISS